MILERTVSAFQMGSLNLKMDLDQTRFIKRELIFTQDIELHNGKCRHFKMYHLKIESSQNTILSKSVLHIELNF
ncbi:hypothetical protein QVD17_01709 [Tagetes erecta]|uniref:Uncharacterized protein n=1 Tax=Tagetes erecta TaxID=13708 RepID=A0AAD8LB34_TARER|nr:hypothetical protein QVD17_01709 [Tagetes erecta]